MFIQSLIIGRKLIKIILKIILNCHFKNYAQKKNEIIVNKYIDSKYIPFNKISNRLIDIIIKKIKKFILMKKLTFYLKI